MHALFKPARYNQEDCSRKMAGYYKVQQQALLSSTQIVYATEAPDQKYDSMRCFGIV